MARKQPRTQLLAPDDVARARFALTKFREGYERAEVDEFLDAATEALRSWAAGVRPPLTAEAVLNVKFAATKFREGYDVENVDDFLDRVAFTLGELERRAREAPAAPTGAAAPAGFPPGGFPPGGAPVPLPGPAAGIPVAAPPGPAVGDAVGAGSAGSAGAVPAPSPTGAAGGPALTLREVTTQLQYASVRAAGTDHVRVVGPDGRAWPVTGVTGDSDGVVIRIG